MSAEHGREPDQLIGFGVPRRHRIALMIVVYFVVRRRKSDRAGGNRFINQFRHLLDLLLGGAPLPIFTKNEAPNCRMTGKKSTIEPDLSFELSSPLRKCAPIEFEGRLQ